MVVVHISVREDQNIRSIPVCTVCFNIKTLYRFFQAGVLIIYDGNRLNLESFHLHTADLHEVRVSQDRIVDTKYLTVFRLLLEQVPGSSDIYGRGSNHFLTNRIDWRVRYLREQLLKVVKKRFTVSG